MEMHEYLIRFEPAPPPEGLRERVLRAGRRRPWRRFLAAMILLGSTTALVWLNASIERRFDRLLGAETTIERRGDPESVRPFAVFAEGPRITTRSWIHLRQAGEGSRS